MDWIPMGWKKPCRMWQIQMKMETVLGCIKTQARSSVIMAPDPAEKDIWSLSLSFGSCSISILMWRLRPLKGRVTADSAVAYCFPFIFWDCFSSPLHCYIENWLVWSSSFCMRVLGRWLLPHPKSCLFPFYWKPGWFSDALQSNAFVLISKQPNNSSPFEGKNMATSEKQSPLNNFFKQISSLRAISQVTPPPPPPI